MYREELFIFFEDDFFSFAEKSNYFFSQRFLTLKARENKMRYRYSATGIIITRRVGEGGFGGEKCNRDLNIWKSRGNKLSKRTSIIIATYEIINHGTYKKEIWLKKKKKENRNWVWIKSLDNYLILIESSTESQNEKKNMLR